MASSDSRLIQDKASGRRSDKMDNQTTPRKTWLVTLAARRSTGRRVCADKSEPRAVLLGRPRLRVASICQRITGVACVSHFMGSPETVSAVVALDEPMYIAARSLPIAAYITPL